MKRFLATCMVFCSLLMLSAPLSYADIVKDSNSFNVSEILSIGAGETDGTLAEGTESLTQQLIDAEEEAGSAAAALILRVINILSLLIGTFAFVMIIIGGFIWSTSAGDESKVDRGKAILTQSLAGLAIAFLSYFIVTFILSFFF
jgi:hypothetical protein